MATALDIELDVDDVLMRRYRDVTVSIEQVDPRRAADYMKRNTKNRPLNKRHGLQLSDAMSAGHWWMNGETIIFASDGTLLNGQHRLWAIISSGVAVDVLVVRGIDEEAFKTLDGGKKRTVGDTLSLQGEKDANKLAGAVSALACYARLRGAISSSSVIGVKKCTALICDRVLSVHPGLRDSVRAMSRNNLFNNQFGFALHYLFSVVDGELASQFADVLSSGDSDIGRPFVVFRECLVRNPMRSDLRIPHAARAIKAFNAERSGDRPQLLRYTEGAGLPDIDGLDYDALCESVK